MTIKAVVFDAFGTLVQIGQPQHPYRKLMKLIRNLGHCPSPLDADMIMTHNVGIVGTATMFNYDIPLHQLQVLEDALFKELPTIDLMPRALDTLHRLRRQGMKVGICSNLAAPYAIPIKLLLKSFQFDSYAWSFEVGAVKPDPKIYEFVLKDLNVLPNEILFVGDTMSADVLGPRNVGMKAVLINHSSAVSNIDSISSLMQVESVIKQHNMF
jgi:HAD superfamily hydrolase (TIGR01549 family)